MYARIRTRARQIAARKPPPFFYADFPQVIAFSNHFFKTDPVVRSLLDFISIRLDENLGHGLKHAILVSLDAGSLMKIECDREGFPPDAAVRRLRIVQCAGLLHDMKRKEPEHAFAGSQYARQVLKSYPFSPHEIEDICRAIRNHEAFKRTIPLDTREGILVSDCLYDADKFRWGPDNFKDMVWDMMISLKIPLSQFMAHYPQSLEKIAAIKTTFRTLTGQKYGPQFIDAGLAIGGELYAVIQKNFSGYL